MLIAITRDVSPNIRNCELKFVDRQPIDHALAVRQLEDYRAALERCGALVKRLPADSRYPDSCFVEDTAIVVNEIAVIASMGAPSRRGETPAIEAELSPYRNIARVRLPATIDGGDVLRAGKNILVGLSSRTNEAGIEQLAQILEPRGYRVTQVRTSKSLHFKSACTAIDDGTLLVNRDWIHLDDLAGFNLVFTPDDEPEAANVLRVNETLFVQAGFPGTVERLRSVHGKVETLDTSELHKAEGALTCLSIIFETRG
ncbi:MAG TPA: arginine deiminase family protein [Blastocatellia bacterium]|jgi:dimethylargininase|nr:arginine deiminase family protein [Blastocatellia bacterium]